MPELKFDTSETASALSLERFIAALNADETRAVSDLRAQGAELSTVENWQWLGGSGVAATFVWWVAWATSSAPAANEILGLRVGVPLFLLAWLAFGALAAAGMSCSRQTAQYWSTPLAQTDKCTAFEALVLAHPELPLMPQAGGRQLYVADYLQAQMLVRANKRAVDASAQREACARLHSRMEP